MNKTKIKWYSVVASGILSLISLVVSVIIISINLNFWYLIMPGLLTTITTILGIRWSKWYSRDEKRAINDLKK